MTESAKRLAHYYSGYHEGGRTRSDFVRSDGVHAMSTGWRRYQPHRATIIEDGRWFTEIQYRIKEFARTHEGDTVTVRVMAESMGIAPSTVSRALLKLAALKLIAYDVVRGRYGGITFLSTSWADLKARSRSAWDRLRMERSRAWNRYVRRLDKSHYWFAGLNVASIEVVNATLNA